MPDAYEQVAASGNPPGRAADTDSSWPANEPASESIPAPYVLPDLPGTVHTDAFRPANSVEADLLAAAQGGHNDRFLSTLLLAKVLLPGWPGEQAPFEPAALPTVEIEGGPHLLAFTSKERLHERLGEDANAGWVKFTRLIAAWPDPGVAFAVNPETVVGATLPGDEIVALANWAAELGLGGEPDPEPVPAKSPVPRPARAPRSASAPLLMQKPISPDQLSFYLDRAYDRVSGFVHRAGEVAHLRTPEELYHALGLSYSGSAFKPDAVEVYVLRWTASRVNLYRIPYGGHHEAGMRAMEGWVIERAPFRGNGFAPSETSDVIAEFKVDSVRLPHGAELWRIDAAGDETLVASLDADGPRWRRVGEA